MRRWSGRHALLRLLLSAAQVQAAQPGDGVLVLRLQRRVVRERDNRAVEVVLLLLGGREGEPGLGVLGVLLGLLLERADRRTGARRALEEVAERVADAGRAGADAEENEAEREDDGEED